MSFSQGVSGLNVAAANLDVIGNNIANSGTVGYKSGSVQFSNVYAGSMQGLGTKVAGIFQDFTAGAVQRSSRPLDVAIVEGDGFFRMTSTGGEVRYTRNGQFDVNKEGFIVNAAGLQLTGFPVTSNGALAGASPVPLQVPNAAMTPAATQVVTAQFNLDARGAVPAATPFNAADSTTYNYSNSVTIFDSLGNTHELSAFFVKTATSKWDVYATADGKPLATGGAFAPAAAIPPAPPVPGSGGTPIGSLAFDGSGKLVVAAAVPPAPATVDTLKFTGLQFTNGSAPLTIDMKMAGTTQFGADNQVRKMVPDGYASGQLTTLSIAQDGTLSGKYSNQQTKLLGQIVLSSFASPNGLQNKGDNVWAETPASGAPLTGTPGSGKTLGSLLGGAVEGSNVDLTAELINLIIAQRTYQANTQTVKTQDQVVQALINMR